eukprot:GFUD01034634.1.p1 GENE.GFUD01034634.1~~GFUD01034634.1.p1  ORF type:complete len:343 (+),score=110.36 GFUD01034634.1:51-1031(+)
MSNFAEQMRLFEAEVGEGLRPPIGGPPPPKPAFMPASVRTHQGGGPPPPPTYSRPGLVKSFTPVQKQYSAAAVISKPSEEEDVFSTLLKYEKEVRAEKREKKQVDKEKKKVKKDKKDSSPALVAAAPAQPTMFKPSHISAQPTAAPVIKPGTQVTPDEIKLKAKQMVELVKATQVIQTKRLPPTQSTSKLPTEREHKTKKPKKMIRVAGGQVWEDTSLLNWDINDFRLFCGDLGNDVTDEVLTRTFSRYPSFQMAKVVRDKRSNKTKGYGFVSFKDPMDFTKAIKEMDGKYVGSRPIKLRKSNWKDRNVDIVKGKQKLKQQMGYKY